MLQPARTVTRRSADARRGRGSAASVLLLVLALALSVTSPAVGSSVAGAADGRATFSGVDSFDLTLGALGLLAVGVALLAARWGIGSRPKHRV